MCYFKKTSHSNVPDYKFMFTSLEDAKQALRTIKATIKMYDVATVADLKAAIGHDSSYTDAKYGWISSDKMAVRMMDVDNPLAGYMLYLPKPYPVEDEGVANVQFKPALSKSAKDAKIQKAYNVLTKAYCRYDTNEDDLADAMGEAIRTLGEVLE